MQTVKKESKFFMAVWSLVISWHTLTDKIKKKFLNEKIRSSDNLKSGLYPGIILYENGEYEDYQICFARFSLGWLTGNKDTCLLPAR
jgi:hypothetical protein